MSSTSNRFFFYNTYYYQVTSISDQQFFGHYADKKIRKHTRTDATKNNTLLRLSASVQGNYRLRRARYNYTIPTQTSLVRRRLGIETILVLIGCGIENRSCRKLVSPSYETRRYI